MKKFSRGVFMALAILFLSVPVLSAKELSLAPDFTLEDTQGNKISLSSYRNKQPVVLFFWTTWCPFCREELKTLSRRYAVLTNANWRIIAVDIGEPAARVNNFTKNAPLAFSVLLDTDSTVAYAYGILGVPTYVLISKEGRIVFRDNYFPEHYETLLSP